MWQISLSNLFKSCQLFASHVRGRSPKGGWGRGYGYIKSTSVEGKHHLPKSSGIFVFFSNHFSFLSGILQVHILSLPGWRYKENSGVHNHFTEHIILKKFWVSSFQLRVIPRIFLNRPCATSRLIFAGSKAQSQQSFSCLQVGEIDVKDNVMDLPSTSTPVLKQLFWFLQLFCFEEERAINTLIPGKWAFTTQFLVDRATYCIPSFNNKSQPPLRYRKYMWRR